MKIGLINYMKKNNLQIIIFGATGDLASLKLFPAIYELFKHHQLPDNFQIIGYGRSAVSENEFRKVFRESVNKKFGESPKDLDKLLEKVFYFQGQYNQVADFEKLNEYCQSFVKKSDQVAYFSVPPLVFEDLVKHLAVTLQKSASSFKIVVEKPFGVNEKTAEHLFKLISANFEEKNVFLLDHFLGKRPIQSILKLRLENNAINMMIRGSEIARIKIEASERNDAGKRVGYYDQVGAIKDMVQSHLLQILALITMEIPAIISLESLQREKQNILSAIRFSKKKKDIVIGQYEGYLLADGVSEKSQTETFVEMNLHIDRREWFDVPVVIKTGKKLANDITRAVIEFKKMPFQDLQVEPNQLVFEMKPGESLSLKLVQRATLKNPEGAVQYESVELEHGLGCKVDFCLGDYASLLNDVLRGEKIYFLSYPEIVAAWKVIDLVEQTISKEKIKPIIYEGRSEGPSFD
jgi:glucose-6-phosphate 1-dehydrogenase